MRVGHHPGSRRLTGALLSVGVAALVAGCGSATSHPPPSSSAAPAPRAAGSGVTGLVTGYTCPAEPADQIPNGCARRPVVARIQALRLPDRRPVEVATSDAAGRFRLDLPPGSYELTATTRNYAYARPLVVRVRPATLARAEIMFLPRHPLPVAPAGCSWCPARPPAIV